MKVFENVAALELARLREGQFVETGGYYEKGGTGAARYFIKTAAQATTDGDDIDGYGNHELANGNVAILQTADDGSVWAEQIGLKDTTHASPTTSSQNNINAAISAFKIKIPDGKFYYTDDAIVISGDRQGIVCNSHWNRGGFYMNDPDYTGHGIQTNNFPDTAYQYIELDNILYVGNKDEFSVAEVNSATGTQGMGFALTIGRSNVNIKTAKTLGVGICFSNGGNSGLYTHVNNIWAVANDTGQEGIIFDGGNDTRISYIESYFAWNSLNDTNYAVSKTSKYKASATICAGILFYSGAAEVVEMHPSNNRHGYAWATYGRSGDSYRLRFDHAIGEGSAGGVYLAPLDDITGGLLNCHSTRGKFGSPLCYIRSLNNVQIAALNIKVDNQSGYPSADGGTALGLKVDGDRCNIENFRVWSTTGKVENHVVYIQGSGHKITGSVYNFLTKEDGSDAVAVKLATGTTACDIDIKVEKCGYGLVGDSGAADPGRLKLSFYDMGVEGISTGYLANLSSETFRISDIYDYDTGDTTDDKLFDSGTLANTLANGVTRTVSIAYSGFYKKPSVKSLYVTNDGSSASNASGINMWVSEITTTHVVVKYNIASYSGDFRIQGTIGHG